MSDIYPFDSEGVLPGNRVYNESHVINTINGIDHNYIVPLMAPFYERSLVIVNTETGQALIENTDFYFGYKYEDGVDNIGAPVAGAIVFIDPLTVGSFNLTYQTVGGDFVDAAAAYIADGIDTLDALLNRDWADVANVPETFPPTVHLQRVDSVDGVEEFLQSAQSIAEAIKGKPTITVADIEGFDMEWAIPLMESLGAIAEAVNSISSAQNIASLSAHSCNGPSNDDIMGPASGVWYDTPVSIEIAQGGIYKVDVAGNPHVSSSAGLTGALLRWVINGTALSDSRLLSTVTTLQAGSVVTLQVMAPVSGTLTRININGSAYGVGMTLTRLRSLA